MRGSVWRSGPISDSRRSAVYLACRVTARGSSRTLCGFPALGGLLRQGRALLVALACLLLLTTGALAAEPTMPPRPEGAPSYEELVPLYDHAEYPFTAYTWDGEQWSATGYAGLYNSMNLALVGKAWFLKVALRLTEWATAPDLITALFERITDPAEAVGEALWAAEGAPLVAGGIALSGGWALLLYLQGRRTRAWGALGATTLVLLLAAAALPNSERIATTLGTTSDGLATALLATGEIGNERPLLVRAGDAAWERFVYEPWLEGELSEQGAERYRNSAGLPGGAFLAMTPAQRRSACLFDGAVDCPGWTVDHLPQRLLSALSTAGMVLLWGGALLFLSGGLLLTRLTLAALMLFAPVWLLVALWRPEQSIGLVRRIGGLAVGVVVKQLLLSAGLLLFLLLSLGVNGVLSDMGWPLPALLLALLGAGAVRYRYAWFRPLAALPGRPVAAPIPREQRERQGRVVVAPPPVEAVPVPVPVEPPRPVVATVAPAPKSEAPESLNERPASLLRRELLLTEARKEQELLQTQVAAGRMAGPGRSDGAVQGGFAAEGAAGRGAAPQRPQAEPVAGPPSGTPTG